MVRNCGLVTLEPGRWSLRLEGLVFSTSAFRAATSQADAVFSTVFKAVDISSFKALLLANWSFGLVVKNESPDKKPQPTAVPHRVCFPG